MKKLLIASIMIGSILTTSMAMAAPNHHAKSLPRLTRGSLKNGGVNCHSYMTDLCIENYKPVKIYFSVPDLGYYFKKIPPNTWVDVNSDDEYDYLNLKIYNQYHNPIYSQVEPNHSVVPVGLEKKTKK